MVIKYFVCSIILLLFSYFVFRVLVRKDYRNRQKLSPFSYVLEALVFALHANFAYLFISAKWPNLPRLPENVTINLVSFAIIGFGLVILIIAWFGLGTRQSFGLDKNKLKTGGIYHFSRNPQIVGCGMIMIAFAILYFSWYSIGWFILYLIISYFMIRTEEEFLGLKYGEVYEKYCNTVPRIIKLL